MPPSRKDGASTTEDVPETLARSDAKARRTYSQAYEAALERYGDAERAARTAWAAVKQTHEKVGDRWRPKEENGSSEPTGASRTHGGVDATASQAHLYGIAQELGIRGRSRMDKKSLIAAIQEENQRRTAQGS